MMGLRQLGCSTGTMQSFRTRFQHIVGDGRPRGDGAEVTASARNHLLPWMISACLTASGCASEGLASLPLPAPRVGSGGYTLTAVFSKTHSTCPPGPR